MQHRLLVIFHALQSANLLHRITIVVSEALRMKEILPRMAVSHLIDHVREENNLLISLVAIEVAYHPFLALISIIGNDTHGLFIVND